jgi:WD40 repeat protein
MGELLNQESFVNSLDKNYQNYQQSFFARQGFESPQDYLRQIMSGKVTRERYDEIESIKLSKDDFLNYYLYPEEKLIDFKVKDKYQREVVFSGGYDINAFQVLPSNEIIFGGYGIYLCTFNGLEGGYNVKTLVSRNTTTDYTHTLRFLPNRDIVSGGDDGKIHLHKFQSHDTYESEVVASHKFYSFGFGNRVNTLEVSPNRDIVSGGANGDIYLHELQSDGTYKSKIIKSHKYISVYALRFLLNGDIVSVGSGCKIYFHKLIDGDYENKVVAEHRNAEVRALRVSSSRDIFSGGGKDIYVHKLNSKGNYESKVIVSHEDSIRTFQVLSNDDIVSGGEDKKIYYWKKQDDGSYQGRILIEEDRSISNLQVTLNQEIFYTVGGEIYKLY